VEDFIERAPTTYMGSDSLDGAPVFHNENQGRARIVGLSGSAEVQLSNTWLVRTSFSWTHGRNTDLDVPLTRIPPLRGSFAARRDWERAWAEAAFQWAARQDRLSPDDQRDSRIPSGGTPGYFVAHLRGGYRITDGLVLRASLENVGDAAYQIHGSGIYMSGRNLVAGLEWELP
jgi:outer membrane receptor protein involved in Fe transport